MTRDENFDPDCPDDHDFDNFEPAIRPQDHATRALHRATCKWQKAKQKLDQATATRAEATRNRVAAPGAYLRAAERYYSAADEVDRRYAVWATLQAPPADVRRMAADLLGAGVDCQALFDLGDLDDIPTEDGAEDCEDVDHTYVGAVNERPDDDDQDGAPPSRQGVAPVVLWR